MESFAPWASVVVAIAMGAGSIIWKLANNRADILQELNKNQTTTDNELADMRTAAFIEYKELRREIEFKIDTAYRELGEAPKALREHVNQFELFVRDKFLQKSDYERDQDRLLLAITTLSESMNKRLDAFEHKVERIVLEQAVQKGAGTIHKTS